MGKEKNVIYFLKYTENVFLIATMGATLASFPLRWAG